MSVVRYGGESSRQKLCRFREFATSGFVERTFSTVRNSRLLRQTQRIEKIALFHCVSLNRIISVIEPARPVDAVDIAAIHLAARQVAMPWLRLAHTEDETRDYFARVVGDRPNTWWVVRQQGEVAAYMLIDGKDLDRLYVSPPRQGQGFGSVLLDKAKVISPVGLLLWTFQRNTPARAFYEARGFRSIKETAGENEEGEPDIQYEWQPTLV